ncbi:MAG: hypothetical protein K2K90_09045, partial [Lachnospiraceae bacterium]|nr:hypothetical protein [Lachnospiraceae bacterium]
MMKRKMIVTLVACGLLTAGLLTGCGQEEKAPAEPPREVIEGEDASETSVQTEEEENTDAADTESASTESAESAGNGMPGMTMQFG